MNKPTTREMSDAHEEFIAKLFGGKVMRGSGNQWNNPADGKQDPSVVTCAFGWDGKSTFGKSISVTIEMWKKLCQQTPGLKRMLPLRWYGDYRLTPVLDLAVLNIHDVAELHERSEKLAEIERLARLVRDGDYEAAGLGSPLDVHNENFELSNLAESVLDIIAR